MRHFYRKLFFILLISGFHLGLQAQPTQVDSTKRVLKIGIKAAPPFVIQEGNHWRGLSVEFWEMLAAKLPYSYELVPYHDLASLLSAVKNHEVDMSINPITVTDHRMTYMSFSQPFYITETAVAQRSSNEWLHLLGNIFSKKFLSALLILFGVIFLFGFLVWLFEHRKNPEEFGGVGKGIAQGFWWSAVTMTTVGYGDKSPRTLGGRIIGFLWMFTAIILISGLTASIASSLTVTKIESSIHSAQDLKKFNVVTIAKSSAAEYLDLFKVPQEPVHSAQEGLKAVANHEADVFVYDRPIMQYYRKNMGLADQVQVLPDGLKTDYYSFSFPKGSPLLEEINPLLVRKLKSADWNYLLEQYEGE